MNTLELLRTNSSKLTKKQIRRKKRLVRFLIGIILVTIEIIAVALFCGSIFKANIIPNKYLVIGMLFLGLVTLYNLFSQLSKSHMVGKCLAVLLSIVCFAGNYYVSGYNKMIDDVTDGGKTETHIMSVIALKSNTTINTIEDARNASFGYIKDKDTDFINDLFGNLNTKFGSVINTKTYSNQTQMINELYSGKCDVIVMNDTSLSMMQSGESDFDKAFIEKTKVIYNHEIHKEILITPPNESVNVKSDTFVVYLAGNDEEGAIASVGRNDVNIVAVINPTSRQILLITTPRDSYVKLKNVNESPTNQFVGPDKLTHAGNFGIEGSIWALEHLFEGLDIDYYAQINFTGVVTLVDALGGVTVNSEIEFTTHRDTSPVPYHFTVGPNYCDGKKALAFCRERQNVALGDIQRGRDQMLMIRAMVDKAMSPTLLTRYSEIMNSISTFFRTNMPKDVISELVKSMLNDPRPWDIQMFNTEVIIPNQLYPSTFWSSSFPSGMACVLINEDSVRMANHLIDCMEKGEKINADAYVTAEKERLQKEKEAASKEAVQKQSQSAISQ